MIVKNYTGLPTAKVIDVNGQKYAIGISDSDDVTILSGKVVESLPHEDGDEIFWAYEKENQQYIQISPIKLAMAITDDASEQYKLTDMIQEI